MSIMPSAMNTIEIHAGLCLVIISRLSCIPVGVSHQRHCIAQRVRSPDERRVAVGVYALSSRPEGSFTSSQCCL